MSVELPSVVTDEAPPTAPSAFVWLALFVVFMLIGVVTTLLTWPKGETTSTPWFWACLLAFPALAWCVAFGLRKNYYEQELGRLDAEGAVRTEDRQEAIRFASEPLAVIASTYECAMDTGNAAAAIVQGDTALKSQKATIDNAQVRHTCLNLTYDGTAQNRFSTLFSKLLGSLHEVLKKLPTDIPFRVCLQLPADTNQDDLLLLWEDSWRELGLRPVKPTLLPIEEGLMALDRWLDVSGGPELQKITLFVSAQLHDKPPIDSAEAGVALLLCWPLVAERKKLDPLAMLHRPVETTAARFKDDIPTAVLWGKAGLDDIRHVWMTGLDKEDKAALNLAASDLKLGIASSEDLSGTHNVDTALGHPGAAASWLTAAIAIENAKQNQEPQMIVCREGPLRLAVVQPIANDNEAETT